MRIEFFKSKTCVKCPTVKKVLEEELAARGLKYSEVVVEKYIENPDNLTDLMMYDELEVPFLVFRKNGKEVYLSSQQLKGDIREKIASVLEAFL